MIDVAYEVVTVCRFEEYDEGFYAGIVNGRYYVIEDAKAINRVLIFCAATRPAEDIRLDLKTRLLDAHEVGLIEKDIRFDDCSLCISLPMIPDLGRNLNKVIEVIGAWATDHRISDSCFICGTCSTHLGPSLIGNLRTVMCEDCKNQLHTEIEEALEQESHKKNTFEQESGHRRLFLRTRGILAALFAGAAIAVPILIFLPGITMPFGWIAEFAFAALIVFVVYGVYKAAAKHFDQFAFASILAISMLILGVLIFYLYSLAQTGAISVSPTDAYVAGGESALQGTVENYQNGVLFMFALPAFLAMIVTGFYIVRKES